jgi:hypothetical protein
MPEEVKQPEPEKKEESLVTRVSQVSKEVTPPTEEDFKFDVKDIDKIEDPKAKEYAEKAYKSFQRGFNNKFQEIAEIRKELEKQKSENTPWTPERIQALLKDQSFVDAAQGVVGSTNDSVLSETEQKRMKQLEQEQAQLKSQLWQTYKAQQDEVLKNKYANYDGGAVDVITSDLLSRKYVATREDLWKAIDYDSAINRAYKLGKQDRQSDTADKVASMSMTGDVNATSTETPIKKEENESDRAYFNRLAMRRLMEFQGKTVKK